MTSPLDLEPLVEPMARAIALRAEGNQDAWQIWAGEARAALSVPELTAHIDALIAAERERAARIAEMHEHRGEIAKAIREQANERQG